jgi:hypothetical protein
MREKELVPEKFQVTTKPEKLGQWGRTVTINSGDQKQLRLLANRIAEILDKENYLNVVNAGETLDDARLYQGGKIAVDLNKHGRLTVANRNDIDAQATNELISAAVEQAVKEVK